MSMEFDFTKGGEVDGVYYPALKDPVQAIKFQSGWKDHDYIHYEPGNGTRYEVVFTEIQREYSDEKELVLSVICPAPAAMTIPGGFRRFYLFDLEYFIEKLRMRPGDVYALLPLVNHYTQVLDRARNER